MDWSEPSVHMPDIKIPATTTRPLYIARRDSDDFTRIDAVNLSVLVNNCLYIVMNQGHRHSPLRAGQVLSRNLDLTRQKRLDPSNLSEQVFVVYDSINDARRDIGRVHGRYRAIKIPELDRWRQDVNKFLRISWTLCRVDPVGDAQFVWRAEQRISQHRADRAEHKVRAAGLLSRVASLTDQTGWRNTPTIPLQCMAADRELAARAQEVRGIGRRMDWRAVVLEHYIDQLRSECWAIRRVAQNALIAADIFSDARTPKTLRTRANRMADYVEFLREVQVRTFSRVFTHVAEELEETCGLLYDAADRRSSTDSLERVRALLSKIYRSMVFIDEHWRLQEILVVVEEHHHRQQPFSWEQIDMFAEELNSIHRTLTTVDPITGDHIDKGFSTDVLPVVLGGTVLARTDLLSTSGVHLQHLYEHLKMACEPL